MKASKETIARLQDLRQHIEQLPPDTYNHQQVYHCGTPCCAFGHAITRPWAEALGFKLTWNSIFYQHIVMLSHFGSWLAATAKLLDCDEEAAKYIWERLFSPHAFGVGTARLVTKSMICERLDQLIEALS